MVRGVGLRRGVEEEGAHYDRSTFWRGKCLLATFGDDLGDFGFLNSTTMGAAGDAKGAVIWAAVVQVQPDRERSLEYRVGGANMEHSCFRRPSGVPGHIDSLSDRDRDILVIRDLPVGPGMLVEIQNANDAAVHHEFLSQFREGTTHRHSCDKGVMVESALARAFSDEWR